MRKGMVLKNPFILLVLTLLLMACASAGQHFIINDANKVTNGMTREEVIAIMGTNPYQIRDQGKTFIWSYAQIGFAGGTKSRAVRFSFDNNGKTYGVPEGGVFGDTQKYLD